MLFWAAKGERQHCLARSRTDSQTIFFNSESWTNLIEMFPLPGVNWSSGKFKSRVSYQGNCFRRGSDSLSIKLLLSFLLESLLFKVEEVTQYVKLLTSSKAEERQDRLLSAFPESPSWTNPNRHHHTGPRVGHTRSLITPLPQEARGGTYARWQLPSSPAPFQRCFPEPALLCPFRNAGRSRRTCPSNSRSSTCDPHRWGHFCSAPCLLAIVPITALPQPGPPRRLSEAAPLVIGISLMKKGWCLSHYGYSEWEYLRTNWLALTREDTSLHPHFPAACGNKRTRFVLTLIRWENREFPKEIKEGKKVGVGPWTFPYAGVQWGTPDSATVRTTPERLAGKRETSRSGSLGCKAGDVASSPGSYVPEWPWTSLGFFSSPQFYYQ